MDHLEEAKKNVDGSPNVSLAHSTIALVEELRKMNKKPAVKSKPFKK